MKLTNVHYEYRGNDIWRIYFKDREEAEAFRNERIDGQKAQIAMLLAIFTNGKGVRYCVEAKLTGQFHILRYYAKDPANDCDIWKSLVKKIEGADSDYIFDEIDLWYAATVDKCYFKICRMNGNWTEPSVRIMLNSQFGMVAQVSGYYDTDTVGEGGLCARHRCCGIGIGHHMDRYGNTKERIRFTIKNFCRGEADIIEASPWTNTFIGTNKENEKEYSWADFKQYMEKLSANGSDIWDIEWEYDAACPMTRTNVTDKVHVYLKPEAYKRLFEREEKEEPKQLLKNITDVLPSVTKVIGCGTLHYYNLYFDYKSDLKHINDKYIKRSILNPVKVKGSYYIQVVSYNNELPKNISSATLVWDQEENRYSVESFTIKKDQNVPAVTPPPVPTWLNLDKDGKIGFRQKDMDEVKKEIDEMTKKLYEKLEIKQVKDFDTATAWHEYLTATETELFIAGCKEKEVKNKEEKNMRLKDVSPKAFYRRLYGEYINTAKIKPTKILIQGTATIIWWSDSTKTVVKCQKGDKMDPEKGIAMCVMKKFMGTNETHSNYLDFAKDAIAEYEKQQAAEKAKKKAEYDKKRREAAKKKGTDGNTNYKRGTKAEKKPKDAEPESKEES